MTIRGKSIKLISADKTDWDSEVGGQENWERCNQIARWLKNNEHMQFSEQRHKRHNAESVKEYRDSFDQENDLIWDIHLDGASDELVGTITVHIDEPNKRAEIGILISPMFSRGGYGSQAWGLVMNYLKEQEKDRVDVIHAGMMMGNTAMRRICEKNGMILAGFVMDQFLYHGQRETCFFYRWVRPA